LEIFIGGKKRSSAVSSGFWEVGMEMRALPRDIYLIPRSYKYPRTQRHAYDRHVAVADAGIRRTFWLSLAYFECETTAVHDKRITGRYSCFS
jgi:hypothetical protein